MKLWRPLLLFYAIGAALMGLASLAYSAPFALALLVFAGSAGWAARSRSRIATVGCGIAGFLPALAATRLDVPGGDPTQFFLAALIGASMWCAVCIIVSRALPVGARPAP